MSYRIVSVVFAEINNQQSIVKVFITQMANRPDDLDAFKFIEEYRINDFIKQFKFSFPAIENVYVEHLSRNHLEELDLSTIYG